MESNQLIIWFKCSEFGEDNVVSTRGDWCGGTVLYCVGVLFNGVGDPKLLRPHSVDEEEDVVGGWETSVVAPVSLPAAIAVPKATVFRIG